MKQDHTITARKTATKTATKSAIKTESAASFMDLFARLRGKAEAESESLPALQALAEKAVMSILHGAHSQYHPGTGEKFWQFRPYVQGDRPQDIDWKQTAKTQGVFIKQKEWQTTQTSVFWCSTAPSMRFSSKVKRPEKLTAARVLTLALAMMMTRAGEQISTLGSRKTGRSAQAVQELGLHLLSDKQSKDSKSSAAQKSIAAAALPETLGSPLPRHAFFVAIGDFLEPLENIEQSFKQFSAQSDGGLIVQILDPAELELPYDGRVLFRDMHGSALEQIENVGAVRDIYKERIESHNALLAKLCKEQKWNYILHRTDTDYKATLAAIWEILSFQSLNHQIGGGAG